MLRFATFNLLHGLSPMQDATDTALLYESAKLLDVDVVGFQEVDRFQPRSGGVDQAALTAEALDARHWQFVPTLRGTLGRDAVAATGTLPDRDPSADRAPSYGIGLASRLPVIRWRMRRFEAAPVGLPLLVPGQRRLTRVSDEPRAALAAVVELPQGGPMTVITAHLSFVPGWNITQLRRIVSWVGDLPAPRLILGDLNLPGTLPRTVTGWRQLARLATYPAHAPRVQFDHMLAVGVGPERVRYAETLHLLVSDHRALVLDLAPY
ncbi:MAG: endonuclease/exonuclease/phosphatase family protein [Carbonactinosporaceae bacterium]